MKKFASTLVLVVAAVSLAGCKPKLDSKKLEGGIKDHFTKGGLETSEVTCPKNIEAAQGGTFECTGKTKEGDLVVTVTQKDAKGNVTFVLKTLAGKSLAELTGEAAKAGAESETEGGDGE